MSNEDENLLAILGPTNTGKTYTAFEKLFSYSTGIFGFPLRLLARENYDKAVKSLAEFLTSSNDKKLKARLNYVLAQIYLENKNYEKAKVALKNVINSGINKSNSLILWSKLIYNNLINSPDYNLFKKLIRSERYRQNISLINYFNAKLTLNSQPKQAKDLFSNA